MFRFILFTFLIAASANSVLAQTEFQPTFPRSLAQAIDQSAPKQVENSSIVPVTPERIEPRRRRAKRVPAIKTSSTQRNRPTTRAARPYTLPSIETDNIYRAPPRDAKMARDMTSSTQLPTQSPEAPAPRSAESSRQHTNQIATQQRIEQQRIEQQRIEQQRLEQQRLEQQRLEQLRLQHQRPEQSVLSRARAARDTDNDMDVQMVQLPAADPEDLPRGSYLFTDQTLGQPSQIDEPEFGTVMTFPAADTDTPKQLNFSDEPKVGAQANAPQTQAQPGASYNFSSSSSEDPNTIGFIPPAVLKTTPRSVVSPPEPPRQIQPAPATTGTGNANPNYPPETNLTPIMPKKLLTTTVIGPESLTPSVPEDFEIVVTNTSEQSAKDVIIQFNVSEDVTITKLDRSAWLDNEKRLVSWKVTEIPAGGKETIYYSAVCESAGRFKQSISLGANGTFQGNTYFDTTVIAPR